MTVITLSGPPGTTEAVPTRLSVPSYTDTVSCPVTWPGSTDKVN